MPELQAMYKESCATGSWSVPQADPSQPVTAELCAQVGYPFMTGAAPVDMYQISPEFHMAPGFIQAVAMAAHPEIWQVDTSKVSAQVSAPPKPAGGSSVMLIAGAAILAYLLIK
jgi:hypothetical protein